jgi:thioredoxin 1
MSDNNQPITLNKHDFDDKVLASSTPTLVDFWADWCAPCHQIAPSVARLADVFQGRLTVGKVNVDEEPELVARYGIRSIPSLLVFRDGEVVDQVRGAVPFKELSQSVERALEAR